MLPPLRFHQKRYSLPNSPPNSSSQKFWIKFEKNKFNIEGLGAWYHYWQEPYHLLLNIPWKYFCLLMVVFYLLLNGGFALAYWVGETGIANAAPGSFSDAFFFSVQTLSTIGYGNMYPTNLFTHSLVTLEAFVSILGIALMTGLAFARFSQSSAKVLFSRVAVILPYDNLPTLMLRVSNLPSAICNYLTSLSGIDESIAQTMYARCNYGFEDILWNHQFLDVVYQTPEGHRYVDLSFFHRAKPLEASELD